MSLKLDYQSDLGSRRKSLDPLALKVFLRPSTWCAAKTDWPGKTQPLESEIDMVFTYCRSPSQP
jgi:hypothetical protein